MWPMLLDMTEEESFKNLRLLELEAYSGLVTALRAQGPLNQEKLKLLKETCNALHIPIDRHKAEVRRAVNDEKLNTIAYYASGQVTTLDEWVQESLRLIPLMSRMAPQTAYSLIADEAADNTNTNNKQPPLPAVCTERKRTSSQSSNIASDINKSVQFRLPENVRQDEAKKRRLPFCTETSSLAQHLMGQPKVSRIQQIYRQRTKAKFKEQQLQMKIKQDQEQQDVTRNLQQINPQKLQYKSPSSPQSKIVQNVSATQSDEIKDTVKTEIAIVEESDLSPQTSSLSENQISKAKQILTSVKCTQNVTINKANSLPGPSGEMQKTYKVCSTRKPLSKAVTTGQKLIVVPSTQSIASNSILQHTLTIPFVKNISVKNLDKFKIVTSSMGTSNFTGVITNSINNTLGNSVKHKVVTVRTNSASKKVIPISQLQLLNAKGSIKVLPIGGKIITKSTMNTTSSLYIVNSNIQALTKSTSSTPVIMTCKMQENCDSKPIVFIKNQDVTDTAQTAEPNKIDVNKSAASDGQDGRDEIQDDSNGKSSILAEILKASGVVPSDSEDADNHHQISTVTCADQGEFNKCDNKETVEQVEFSEGDVTCGNSNEKSSANKESIKVECNETLSPITTFSDYQDKEFEEQSDTYFILRPEQDAEFVPYQNDEECAASTTVTDDVNCTENINEQYSIEISSEPNCVNDSLQMEESIVLDLQGSDVADLSVTN